MKTAVKKIEKNKVRLEVEVPESDVRKAIDKAYQAIAQEVKFDGFRKGKVPSSVIDKKVGTEVVLERAIKESLPLFYFMAVEASKIKPVSQPKVDMDINQFKKDELFAFSVEVEVEPEVKPVKYKGIKIKKSPVEVSNEEVNLQLEILRDKFARLEPVKRAIKEKDFALINFEGYIDGKSFEGGSAQDFLLEVGSKRFIPGFEDQLIGMGAGEIKDIMVEFPQDYAFPDIVGKKANFRVFVKEVKQKVLPELNDAFAAEVGGFNSLDGLRESMKERLKEAKMSQVEQKVRADIMNELINKTKVEIPSVMIDNKVDEMIEEFEYGLRERGFNLKDYLEATRSTIDEIEENLRSDATNRIKRELIMAAIADEEKIEVTDEDIESEIDFYAKSINKSPDELKETLAKTGNTELLKKDLRLRRAFDWVVENAIIKEEKGSRKGEKES